MRLTAGQQHRASIANRNHRMNNNDCWGNPRPAKPVTHDNTHNSMTWDAKLQRWVCSECGYIYGGSK